MGEEGDLCVRMLDRGYVTRLGNAEPMHHLESPQRIYKRAALYGRRNDILFGWHNVPLLSLPRYWASATVGGLWFGLRIRGPWRMLQGLLWGYGSVLTHLRPHPVAAQTYRLFRRLKRHPGAALEEIESRLPPLPSC